MDGQRRSVTDCANESLAGRRPGGGGGSRSATATARARPGPGWRRGSASARGRSDQEGGGAEQGGIKASP